MASSLDDVAREQGSSALKDFLSVAHNDDGSLSSSAVQTASGGLLPSLGGIIVDVVTQYGAKVDGATDDTTAWQNAINAVVAAGGGIIYSSKQGVSRINGAQQTGTAQAYSYSGQILFPARAKSTTTGKITVKILGTYPLAPVWHDVDGGGQDAANEGLVLLSNATTGAVFDAIPGFKISSLYPFTNIKVIFEDIAVRCPANPGCNGINGEALADLAFRGLCRVDTTEDGQGAVTLPTGGGSGVIFPGPGNNAEISQSGGQLEVCGFPTGVMHAECLNVQTLKLVFCGKALYPYGTPLTVATYGLVFAHGCPTVIFSDSNGGGCRIRGTISIEWDVTGSFGATNFIDDALANLYGDLTVIEPSGKGLPVNGGTNLNWRLLDGRDYLSRPPIDTFTRVKYGTNVGTCDTTGHPWTVYNSPNNGPFVVAANSLKGSAGANARWLYTRFDPGRQHASRAVRLVVTPVTGGGAYNVGAILGLVAAKNNASKTAFLFVNLVGGVVKIQKWTGGDGLAGVNTLLASSAGGLVTSGVTYTLDCVVSNPVGGSFVVTAYLNGVQAVTYTLNATDISDIADADGITKVRDGVYIYADLNSVVSQFAAYHPN